MADYFTKFSAHLPMKSEDAANAALCFLVEARDASEGDDAPRFHGFDAVYDHLGPDGTPRLWIHSDCGSPDDAVDFVQECATRDLTAAGLWALIWSFDCSKPRIDAYGGGAILVDLSSGEVLESVDLSHWVGQTAARFAPAEAAPP